MPPHPSHIHRPDLIARILAEAVPFVVVEAPAGMGKSRLLEEIAELTGQPVARGDTPPDASLGGKTGGASDRLLWDIPPGAVPSRLPEHVSGMPGLIIAKRPETRLPGLVRAQVYGQVAKFDAADLFLTVDQLTGAGHPEPAVALARCGGWPFLLHLAGEDADPDAIATFLRDELLADLPMDALVGLQIVLEQPDAPLPRQVLERIPFARPGQPLGPALQALRTPLSAAHAACVERARADHATARVLAAAQFALGRSHEAIATLQSIGAWNAAVEALRMAGGSYYSDIHGPADFDAMLARFPAELLQKDALLVTCRAMQAAKNGEIEACRNILAQRWPGAADPLAMLADRRVGFEARMFRFTVMPWEDIAPTPAIMSAAQQLLAEIPPGNHRLHGAYANVMLELYIHARRFAEAEHEAKRAAKHYAQVGIPILSFYIDLHRAIIALFLGEVRRGQQHAVSARKFLRAVPYGIEAETRILRAVEACIDFESGKPEPLARLLAQEFDLLVQGQLWPALVELVLTHGSLALGESRSMQAARALLGVWHAVAARSDRFDTLIAIREVAMSQNAGRWAEAGYAARQITLGPAPDAPLRQGPAALRALTDRDQIALALVWLRQFAWLEPRRAGLEEMLEAMAANPALTLRQRLSGQIWRAHVLRRYRRRMAEAQALVVKVFTQIEATGMRAVLIEERVFLHDLITSDTIREGIERSPQAQRVLRVLRRAEPENLRRARAFGLTRQESRILHVLAEGAGNKAIANTLGLSESTVKFHLKNIFRKLGAESRRAALAAASDAGLLT